MIIHNQAVQVNKNNLVNSGKSIASQNDMVNIPIIVYGVGNSSIPNYTISKNKNELFGNSLKDENDITGVIVNGATISLNQLKETPVSVIKRIEVFMGNGNKISGNYKVGGETYSLPSNSLNAITKNSMTIYVPSFILQNQDKCSVTINGQNYTGIQNGNYFEVNGPINLNSNGVNNVTLNINNNKSATNSQNESTQLIVINQNGTELSSVNLNHPTGLQLALQVAKLKGNITSMQYNGNYLDLNQLMDEQYQPGSQNMLVITEYSEPTINVHVDFSHQWNGQTYNYDMYVPNLNDLINQDNSVNSTGAVLNLPSALINKFYINSVTIDGISYRGYLKGNQYIVENYIPTEPNYNVQINATRKVW
ncbi:MAG: hypothetical protein ACRDD2_06670 [Sarcina sp.]